MQSGESELLFILVFGVLLLGVLLLGVMLLPGIFYLRSLQKALERCAPESRTTTPGSVWLMVIPLFGLVYQFILVGHLARSLRNEFNRRGIQEPSEEPGKGIGIAMGVLELTAIIPIVGIVTGIAGFVCWIIYWVKISDYSNRIAAPYTGLPSPSAMS